MPIDNYWYWNVLDVVDLLWHGFLQALISFNYDIAKVFPDKGMDINSCSGTMRSDGTVSCIVMNTAPCGYNSSKTVQQQRYGQIVFFRNTRTILHSAENDKFSEHFESRLFAVSCMAKVTWNL